MQLLVKRTFILDSFLAYDKDGDKLISRKEFTMLI
jgi:hypothetical protein